MQVANIHSTPATGSNQPLDESRIGADIARVKCFACGRKLGQNPYHAVTIDDQLVKIGTECRKMILAAGEDGWQPAKGGPKIRPLRAGEFAAKLEALAR